jgi:hypothetical protein
MVPIGIWITFVRALALALVAAVFCVLVGGDSTRSTPKTRLRDGVGTADLRNL